MINDILENPKIDKLCNKAVRDGYDLAAEILAEDLDDIKKVNFTKVNSIQGRAIGMLAVDYLKGECTRQALIGVPLK